MANLLSIVIGVISLILLIVSFIPLLGWGNWIVLPIAGVGAALGALSGKDNGRNFCLVIFVLAIGRLWIGGGVI